MQSNSEPARDLEQRIGHRFARPELAAAALTHRSARGPSNERLEFLGDAVLGLAIAEALYARKPDLPEGDLTRMRASLVNRESLAAVARSIDLGKILELGSGEKRSGGFQRRSILEDALEAVIGAVFMDAGYAAAKSTVERLFGERLAALPHPEALKDPKTRLQEVLQGRGLALPEYRIVGAGGPEHERHFTAECRVPELDLLRSGTGRSRRRAEQAAAAQLLEALEQ